MRTKKQVIEDIRNIRKGCGRDISKVSNEKTCGGFDLCRECRLVLINLNSEYNVLENS